MRDRWEPDNSPHETPPTILEVDNYMMGILEPLVKLTESNDPRYKPLSLDEYDWKLIGNDLGNGEIIPTFMLAGILESGLIQYVENIKRVIGKSGAKWFDYFADNLWLPQESMHGPFFRECIIRSGLMSQEEIDEMILNVKNGPQPVGDYTTDLGALTYFTGQETGTGGGYHAMHKSTNDPVVNPGLLNVCRQEIFHSRIGVLGLQATLQADPSRKQEVAVALANQKMPGHFIPGLEGIQRESDQWIENNPHLIAGFKLKYVTDAVNALGKKDAAAALIEYRSKQSGRLHPIQLLRIANISPINTIFVEREKTKLRKLKTSRTAA